MAIPVSWKRVESTFHCFMRHAQYHFGDVDNLLMHVCGCALRTTCSNGSKFLSVQEPNLVRRLSRRLQLSKSVARLGGKWICRESGHFQNGGPSLLVTLPMFVEPVSLLNHGSSLRWSQEGGHQQHLAAAASGPGLRAGALALVGASG